MTWRKVECPVVVIRPGIDKANPTMVLMPGVVELQLHDSYNPAALLVTEATYQPTIPSSEGDTPLFTISLQ